MGQYARFDDDWFDDFCEIAKGQNAEALKALRDELFEIGQYHRRIIETTPCNLKGAPFDKTLTQRGDWLQTNVVRPTQKLLAAIADDQRPWFSTWPYEQQFKEFPDRPRLRADLQEVLDFSTQLLANIRAEQGVDAGTNQELRFYIFKDIFAAVRKHLPDFKPKQGVYHKVADGKTKRFIDPFPDAIRHIYAEITGRDEQLVRLIRMVVENPKWDL